MSQDTFIYGEKHSPCAFVSGSGLDLHVLEAGGSLQGLRPWLIIWVKDSFAKAHHGGHAEA